MPQRYATLELDSSRLARQVAVIVEDRVIYSRQDAGWQTLASATWRLFQVASSIPPEPPPCAAGHQLSRCQVERHGTLTEAPTSPSKLGPDLGDPLLNKTRKATSCTQPNATGTK
ncbi:hypothetical protein F5144DRAFT_589145 [Chaetomium tenue]|uniref:Uncharacterized protein n=1 Tax=Chaetomium tenue TaxID=1854479 RepID=A0ACB7PRM1_9PEZI|nr:hypothetical protein F5144DRAFT_589145 [Chaetomium globosum]